MTIYLNIPGVEGTVSSENHRGYIEIYDADFLGVSTPITMITGRPTDRMNGSPSFGQIAILKKLDKSSYKLFEAVHSAKVYPSIELHYVTLIGGEQTTYAITKLTNAAFTHYSECFSSDTGVPEEHIRIAYTQIQRTYKPRSEIGGFQSPLITGYDLEQAKAL